MISAVAATAGACAPLDPEDLEETAAPAPEGEFFIEPGGDSCPPNSCGDPNSPVIDGVYFWRLNLPSVLGGQGLGNPEKVRIVAIYRPGAGNVPMKLELVGGDRLRGIDGAANLWEHTNLEGTRIVVSKKDAQGVVKQYVIWIEDVSPGGTGAGPAAEHFWVGNKHSIEAYDFYFRPISEPDTRIPLCEQGKDPARLRALVFGGDIYNPRTKNILIGPETDGWINIACVDSALYKMHKFAHTTPGAAKAGIAAPSVPRRRAVLNAWTSNVCVTDEVFTQQGELIMLRESLNLLSPVDPYFYPSLLLADPYFYANTVEAIWGPEGAVCLSTHRREDDETGIYERIEDACGTLPRCEDLPGLWNQHGVVVTGIP